MNLSTNSTDSGEVASIDRTAYPNNGPRITIEVIEDSIKSEHYFTAFEGVIGSHIVSAEKVSVTEVEGSAPEALQLLTFCVLVMKNGFTVVGTSACASPSNFSQEIGNKVARQDAVNKIWPLLGFQLVTDLHRIKVHGDGDQSELDEAMTRLLAHELGNPEALRTGDAQILLHKLEELLPEKE